MKMNLTIFKYKNKFHLELKQLMKNLDLVPIVLLKLSEMLFWQFCADVSNKFKPITVIIRKLCLRHLQITPCSKRA